MHASTGACGICTTVHTSGGRILVAHVLQAPKLSFWTARSTFNAWHGMPWLIASGRTDRGADLAIAVLGVYCVDKEGGAVVPHKVKDPCRCPQQPVSLHSKRNRVNRHILSTCRPHEVGIMGWPSHSVSRLHKRAPSSQEMRIFWCFQRAYCGDDKHPVTSGCTLAVAWLMLTHDAPSNNN